MDGFAESLYCKVLGIFLKLVPFSFLRLFTVSKGDHGQMLLSSSGYSTNAVLTSFLMLSYSYMVE